MTAVGITSRPQVERSRGSCVVSGYTGTLTLRSLDAMDLRAAKPSLLDYEAFGPYNVYHLGRGLTLNIGATQAYLRGGPTLFETYEVEDGPEEGWPCPPEQYATIVETAQSFVGLRVVALGRKQLTTPVPGFKEIPPVGEPSHVVLPQEITFRIGQFVAKGPQVAAYIVYVGDTIRHYAAVISGVTYQNIDQIVAAQFVSNVFEWVSYGKVGPTFLDELVAGDTAKFKPAFFLENLRDAIDSVVSGVLRSHHHFVNLTRCLWRANQTTHLEQMNAYKNDGESVEEIKHTSSTVDEICMEFTSGVIASYSTLDMLYQLWVLVVRTPFGGPDFPNKLHFPDSNPGDSLKKWNVSVPQGLQLPDLARAIPNLSKGHFADLRKLRNDLVHNMASDDVRALVYIGIGLPPINGRSLQYAHYLTRDIEKGGDSVTHPWVRRFYQQQRDAQEELYRWNLEITQCVIDTLEWLSIYLKYVAGLEGTEDRDYVRQEPL